MPLGPIQLGCLTAYHSHPSPHFPSTVFLHSDFQERPDEIGNREPTKLAMSVPLSLSFSKTKKDISIAAKGDKDKNIALRKH